MVWGWMKIKNLCFWDEQSFTTPGTTNEKGSGLGMILCKDFIEKHSGEIWVESNSGKGSEFSSQSQQYQRKEPTN